MKIKMAMHEFVGLKMAAQSFTFLSYKVRALLCLEPAALSDYFDY